MKKEGELTEELGFEIPILFLVFNRLDKTRKVFEVIKLIKPQKLYIASDGPRIERPGEDDKVKSVRDFIINNITWECTLNTLFRNENLGCKYGVSSAINWFFDNEEMGIILEDDCLPVLSFFPYCKELLKKYKDDTRIWHLSGCNPIDKEYKSKNSYLFSHLPGIWGWASWRRAWKHFDVNMRLWEQAKIDKITRTYPFLWNRNQSWEDTYNNKIDTWDHQWCFAIACNGGLSVVPNCNLIRNIGFGSDATHTIKEDSEMGNLVSNEMPFPLKHPNFIFYDKEYDRLFLSKVLKDAGLLTRFKFAIYKALDQLR